MWFPLLSLLATWLIGAEGQLVLHLVALPSLGPSILALPLSLLVAHQLGERADPRTWSSWTLGYLCLVVLPSTLLAARHGFGNYIAPPRMVLALALPVCLALGYGWLHARHTELVRTACGGLVGGGLGVTAAVLFTLVMLDASDTSGDDRVGMGLLALAVLLESVAVFLVTWRLTGRGAAYALTTPGFLGQFFLLLFLGLPDAWRSSHFLRVHPELQLGMAVLGALALSLAVLRLREGRWGRSALALAASVICCALPTYSVGMPGGVEELAFIELPASGEEPLLPAWLLCERNSRSLNY